MIRSPIVAGKFYPESPARLNKMIWGMVDEKAAREEVIGLISPHAGYIYSGAVAAATLSRVKPKDTFIVLGPNHSGRGRPFSIMTEGVWRTPLGDVAIDSQLASQILDDSAYLEDDYGAHEYEHSIEVQLPFLKYFMQDFKLVPIVLSHAASSIYKEIGSAIARAVKDLSRKTVIIASSDMTHYEPYESAWMKDNSAVEAILALDEDELLKRVHELKISMCGYAPVVSLISAAKKLGAKTTELVSYQTSGDASDDYRSVVGYAGIIIKGVEMSPLVKVAKETVETYVKKGKVLEPPDELTPEMKETAGVFVSIYKCGELRGCIGTFEPVEKNVIEEVIANAISSATRDPRFPPVAFNDLKDLDYNVDVLTRPKPVANKDQLDHKKHGLIVEAGSKRGLLLPDLEGVVSVDHQISICRQKAGIELDEPIVLYYFQVKRYE